MSKQRESNIELMRIVSILLIVMMHGMAPLLETHNIVNQEIMLAINGVANAGVSIFILISGYFGVRFRWDRFWGIVGVVWFYGVLSFVVDKWVLGVNLMPKDYIQYFLPLICRKFWFITCYVVVYFLSPWLNRVSESLERADFKKLIQVLVAFFWVVPTVVVFFEIMNDGGKGIVNMIGLYLIGRYLRKYGFPEYVRKYAGFMVLGCIIVMFVMNSGLSLALKLVNLRFCRDNSVFILMESIALFYLGMQMRFTSKVVNYLAKYAFPLYLINCTVLSVLDRFYPVDVESLGAWMMIGMNIIVVVGCCLVVETVRKFICMFLPSALVHPTFTLYKIP